VLPTILPVPLVSPATIDSCCIVLSVARRCVPTFVDIGSQANEILFNSSTDLQALANMSSDLSFSDVFLKISVQSIVDGSL